MDEVDTVTVPSIDTPIAEEPLKEEITVSSEGVAEKATLAWKKNDTEATDNAQWKTTYQAYVTLTAADGYAFTNTTGATLNEGSVDEENITLNADGTLTVYCGEYTTATRKTEGATAPEVPTQFTIGDNAFYGCKKLKTVKFGKNVKIIGNKAFYKCSALTKITIPSKVKTIGKSAFYECKKLKTVTIGKSVTKIGSKAFYGCSKIKTLTIKSSKLTTKKIGSKAFSKTPKSMTVKVPKKKFKAYKSMLIKRGVNKKARFKKS